MEASASRSKKWAVILAGGDGTRLRQLTRRIAGDERPKQFCPILGRETLFEQTERRVARSVDSDRIITVLTQTHEHFYRSILSDVPRSQLVIQPMNKGTAPAILYSLMRIAKKANDSDTVAFFPSDHYFSDDEAFMAHVDVAFSAAGAQPERIILLGIAPEGPESEYGWIEPAGSILSELPGSITQVARFWEKPSPHFARELMAMGCLWNSFVMVGRVSAFLELIQRTLPHLYRIFIAVRHELGPAMERAAVHAMYDHIDPLNFSHEVLSRRPERLSVLRVSGVGWSDWGEPQRVLSTLAQLGVKAEWAASTA